MVNLARRPMPRSSGGGLYSNCTHGVGEIGGIYASGVTVVRARGSWWAIRARLLPTGAGPPLDGPSRCDPVPGPVEVIPGAGTGGG